MTGKRGTIRGGMGKGGKMGKKKMGSKCAEMHRNCTGMTLICTSLTLF